ncbi:MAG: 3-isopropylmalate dehydratase small subunit [Gammaproteobacteria bacterium]|nr:3-isopropylmalate dehydratase small subunit [Gammaproteobacteria bacterium]
MNDLFQRHTGIAAPFMHDNVDTDTIIPSREMRSGTKSGMSDGLFADWRYTNRQSRELNPEFVLNQEAFRDASILLTGRNFGCGSSREHAVWALREFGFRCFIGHSFSSIFAHNCVRNGILTVRLGAAQLQQLVSRAVDPLQSNQLTVNLETQQITVDDQIIQFDYPQRLRGLLLSGLDPIRYTQRLQNELDAWRENDMKVRPWLYGYGK